MPKMVSLFPRGNSKLNAIQHLLEQMSVKLSHRVLTDLGHAWTHTDTCENGFKIYSLVSGHGYIQIEGSDRWTPLESGDVVIVFSSRPHTLAHHPAPNLLHECQTRIHCLDVEMSRDDMTLMFHPLPNSIALRNIVFETLTSENEMEYLTRILGSLVATRPDLTGLLKAWCDEKIGVYVQLLWNTSQHSDRLPSKQLELVLGMTESEFKARLRLRSSRELLHNTDLGIPEISAKLGFSNDEAFIRDFFERYGTNPMVYRVKRNELASGVRSHH